jgi:hypothetical protein
MINVPKDPHLSCIVVECDRSETTAIAGTPDVRRAFAGVLVLSELMMNESEYLRERAQECHRMARSTKLRAVVAQLEAQAAEFERRATALEARLDSLK